MLSDDIRFECIQLNDDAFMPLIGLGTFKLKGIDLVKKTVENALETGYRSFDTAEVYKNEENLGEALAELMPKFNLKRTNIFLISKLGPKSHGDATIRKQLQKSLKALRVTYIDLYLIHWPAVQGFQPNDSRNKPTRLQTWTTMCTLKKEGLIKSVGVANFNESHLDSLVEFTKNNKLSIPAVLQSECHPLLNQISVRHKCSQLGIHFQSYSTLGMGKLLENMELASIAKRNNMTISKLLLTWAVQQKIGVIPKSTDPFHIKENIEIFDKKIPLSDMDKIKALDNGTHFCWNPDTVL